MPQSARFLGAIANRVDALFCDAAGGCIVKHPTVASERAFAWQGTLTMPDPSQLTERQAKWFQSVRDGLERATGRSLDDWAQIARDCPEQAHRARLAWMKTHHGLGQNHASIVLDAAFPKDISWSKPDGLADVLWSDQHAAALFETIRARITELPEVIVGQRKSFTAFSRKVQFAAARPVKRGGVMLGLALEPAASPRLAAPGRESWSERLKSALAITRPEQIDDDLLALVRQAWERS